MQKTTKKREFKNYQDYVCTSQTQLDDMVELVPLDDNDLEFNTKVHEVLEVGKTYTYNDMCKLLGEKAQGGNGKQLQLSHWYQHMDWEYPINPKTKKPSKSMLITKIYDTPRQRIDTRQQLQHFKGQQLELNFVFSILDNNNLNIQVGDYGHIVAIKARDMYENIGIINKNYYLMRDNKEAIKDFVPIEEQNYMYRSMEEGNKRYTLGALNRLKRAKVVTDYSYTYVWYNRGHKEHLATDKQALAIENGIDKTIEYAKEVYDITLKNIGELYDNTVIRNRETKEHLLEYLKTTIQKDIPTFEYYQRAYKVTFLNKRMKEYVNKVSNELSISLDSLKCSKMLETRTERTQIQCTRINKKYPKAINPTLDYNDRAIRLQRVISDNIVYKPLTDKDHELKQDTEYLTKSVEFSNYLKDLAKNEEFNELMNIVMDKERYKSANENEKERIKTFVSEATTYMYMPIVVLSSSVNGVVNEIIEFMELAETIQELDYKPTSLFIECDQHSFTNQNIDLTLHINGKRDGKSVANKIMLKVHDKYDIQRLQAYLFAQFKCKTIVGKSKLMKSHPSNITLE